MLQIVQKYLDLFIDRHMDLIGKLRGAQIRAEKDGSGTVRWPFVRSDVRSDVMNPAVPQVRLPADLPSFILLQLLAPATPPKGGLSVPRLLFIYLLLLSFVIVRCLCRLTRSFF